MPRPSRDRCVLPRNLPLAVLAAALLATPAAANELHHGRDRFEGLKPGEFVTHELKIPVRVVLIGFDEGAVDPGTLLGLLPATYKPVVRYPQFYGLSGRDLGLEYEFAYTLVHKRRAFADRFFARLAAIGREGPRTVYQTLYNGQLNKLPGVEVPETVLYIDGPSVERWLEKNDAGGDDQYTIYFVNWYGRDDFRFHLYTKTDEPDPDNGFNFGLADSRKAIAWGGTSGRSWFYDFSAGPEWNGSNWNVDDPDVDGDALADYRIPVIWEYAFPLGYRLPQLLSFDMGLLVRFVAIDLLFTPSPLYDPLVTAPEPFGRKIAHVTMFEDNPAQKGTELIDPAFARGKLESFQPYYRWRVNLSDRDPIDDGAKKALDIFTFNNVVDDCWTAFGDPFAQLFCYFDENRASYVPPYRSRDYVAPVFAFNTTDAGIGAYLLLGLLGYADDNWVDGTQSFVFAFGAPGYGPFYAFTSTTLHELGHHIGLSHPHDGYDSELGVDYAAAGFLYFAWAGGESDTVMHYLGLSNGFGRHNRDNMRRWETAGYLNRANALAGDLVASPEARKARATLRRADAYAAKAGRALKRWDYLDAATNARWAYSLLAEAAKELGVSSARLSLARTPLPNAPLPKTGCRPRQAPEEQQVAP